MSQLTSHVLDTSRGLPAQGIDVILKQITDTGEIEVAKGITNADGRVGDLLPKDVVLSPSNYKLIFLTGKYFDNQSLAVFYPFVEIIFHISDASHYHIPLLLSQYGYTTYRGS